MSAAKSPLGLVCPLCKGPLFPGENGLQCPAGHSFDRAREGYVNLLPVQKKRTKDPGDSKEMVNARHAFLAESYYAPFRRALAELCLACAPRNPHVVDAGCGEGSYDRAVWQALAARGDTPSLIGFDISRPAVRLAARGLPEARFCVAGSFAAPVETGWADVVLNIFSPMAREEFLRILRPGGVLLYAVPTARHLFGLKQALYATPYENSEKQVDYEGFDFVERRDVTDTVTVPGSQLKNLFAMTPYYWKTPREGAEGLERLESLTTEIGFSFLVYRKQNGEK